MEIDTVRTTTASITGLPLNTLCFWRVSAANAGDASPFSLVRSFTTVPAPPAAPALISPANSATDQPTSIRSFRTVPPAPAAPTLASPLDGAVDQATTLTLSWNASANATLYELQEATDSAFASLVVHLDSLSSTTRQVNGLANGTTYAWRVRQTRED